MNEEDLVSWIRFSLVGGMTAKVALSLVHEFELPEKVFEMPAYVVGRVIGQNAALSLMSAENEKRARQIFSWLSRTENTGALPISDPSYPVDLIRAGNPPTVLYWRGNLQALQCEKRVAVLGSRNPDGEGRENARNFGRALAANGCAVVTNLSEGIEREAAHGALLAQEQGERQGLGPVIAVLATGINKVYPMVNKDVFQRVARTGLMISAYPPGTEFAETHLEERIPLLVGMAQKLLVVQASARSASLTYARCAAEMGRDVLTIPGSIHATLYKGNHRLLREGAKLVESVRDIFDGYVP